MENDLQRPWLPPEMKGFSPSGRLLRQEDRFSRADACVPPNICRRNNCHGILPGPVHKHPLHPAPYISWKGNRGECLFKRSEYIMDTIFFSCFSNQFFRRWVIISDFVIPGLLDNNVAIRPAAYAAEMDVPA